METGLLHNYFGNFSTSDERYYFCMKGSMQDEIEPMWGENEMNLRKQENCRKLIILTWVEGTFIGHS